MADKVQLIKEEIERLKTQNETYLDKEYAESTKWYKHGAYDACNAILSFIDSLPEENHFEDKSEMVIEDLEEEILCRWEDDPHTLWPKCPYSDFKNIAHHFAEWQKQRDQETIELAEDHAMLAGMNKMKEEMMKDALNCSIIMHPNDRFANYSISAYVPPLHPASTYISNGDKVKIIIIKED